LKGGYVTDHTADTVCRCFRWVGRFSGKIHFSQSARSPRYETSNMWGGSGR